MYVGSSRVVAWALLSGSVLACSASTPSEQRPDNTQGGGSNGANGGTGAGSGSGPVANGNTGGGIGLPPVQLPTGGTPVVPDDDPGNPNITHPTCGAGFCEDFPATPILGENVPANAPMLFGEPDNFGAGDLCVLEPQLSAGATPGTMIPANWLRPRFRFNATGLDLFEIRIRTASQKHELVAYTRKSSWYMPKEIWAGLGTPGVDKVPAAGNGAANNGAGAPFTVTIRGVNSAAPGKPVGVKGDFHVAPVVATGSMVFWTVNSSQVTPDSSKLLGFAVGDEGVAETLKLTDLKWAGQIGEDGSVLRGYYDMPKVPGFVDGQVRCIGCHTSTPDGSSVVFTDDWPWAKAVASVAAGSIGAVPPYVTPGARALLKLPWLGTQTMSPAHWMPGDRILITTYGVSTRSGAPRNKAWFGLPNPSNPDKIKMHHLAWIDLETTAVINDAVTSVPDYGQNLDGRQAAVLAAQNQGWGLIATGDVGVGAASPNMNRAGDKIVYTVTDYAPDGHADYTATTADIKVVPYNNKAGGVSQPLAGASDPNFLEYYPAYSADDKWIAFTRAPKPGATSPDGPYYNRFGEIHIVPSEGGTSTSLIANTPNTCGGDDLKRGVINSWPKWSPDAFSAHGKRYYFVIFSSARKYKDEFSEQFQLPLSPTSAFAGLTDSSQLWMAAISVDEATKEVVTYPALYIWNQNRLAAAGAGQSIRFSNLTPAWDPFKLPPIEIPEVPAEEPPK